MSIAPPPQPPPTLPGPGPRLDVLPADLRAALARPKLPGLGGLRAICAGLVVLYHLGVPYVPGGYGVLAFFVLSGFLITWLLLDEERVNGRISLRDFYIRRSLRIFPAFYVYGLLAGALWWWTSQHGGRPFNWMQVLAAATYTNNYYQAIAGDPNSVLSHTWSLAVEEQFYLLWPFAFSLLPMSRRRLALTVLIVAVTLNRVQIQYVWHNDHYAYEAFDGRADHLLYGCLLAVTVWEGRWSRAWHVLCSGPGAMLVVASLIALSTQLPAVWGAPYRNLVGFSVEPILTAVLILQAIASWNWPAVRWLHHPWAEKLGAWSYSTYLYQQLAIGAASRLPAAVAPVAGLVGTYVSAWASARFVERPFLRWKHRFERQR